MHLETVNKLKEISVNYELHVLTLQQEPQGMSYSRFINGLKKANVTINRKMLSELAINEPKTFDMLIKLSKEA